MRLGAHLSIAQGLEGAARTAIQIGANTFQYFTRNPRGGKARSIGGEEITRWLSLRRDLDLYPIAGHLPYTVNPAAPPGRQRDFARLVLTEDLERVRSIGGEYIVAHPGRYGENREEAIGYLVSLIEETVLAAPPGGPVLLLETMACQGSELGSLEDLLEVLKRLSWPPQVGICLDTAHLFEAGWDLRTPAGCDELVARLESFFGLEKVKLVHLNDSLTPLSSRRDRHALIGTGELGESGIASVVNHPFLGSLPLILETNVENYIDYAGEIKKVKAFLKKCPDTK